jgi:hypothetical protein
LSCPYFQADCTESVLPAGSMSCLKCRRFLKSCRECGTHNRAFANFCRSCRATLPADHGNWLSYKGTAQRLGASSHPTEMVGGGALKIRDKALRMQLGDTCRSLLGYDRHLIAVSQSGTIEIGDPEGAATTVRLKAEGPISCEPCIDQGVLYLGSPGRLSAYSLGALTHSTPQLAPLWQLPLSGTPIHALACLGNRLYVTVSVTQVRREVQVVENLERKPPLAPRTLHAGAKVGWVAGDPASEQIVFFSQEDESLHLHTVAQPTTRAELRSASLIRVPLPFADHLPIALLGGKIFGVFGDEDKLCRIDAFTGDFEQSLGPDVKLFSLSRDRDRGWDGDGVQIDTGGISFLRTGQRVSLAPLERVVKGSPVLLQGRAAAIGLQDGQLRIYDLHHLPLYEVRRLTGDGEAITALVSFQSYIAAGTIKGDVRVYEVHGEAAG